MFSNFASSFAWLAPSEQNVISTAGFNERESRSRSRKLSGKSVYDLVKIKNQSRKQSHKRNGVGVRRSERFHFLPTPLTTPSKSHDLVKTRLSESEEEAER